MTIQLVAFDPRLSLDALGRILVRLRMQRVGEQLDRSHIGLCSEPLRNWYREMSVVFPSSRMDDAGALPDEAPYLIERLADYVFSDLSIEMAVLDTVEPQAESHAMAVADKLGVAVMNLSATLPRYSWPL